MKNDLWLTPDWDAPASVRAVVTTRAMFGQSKAPFDSFNLGSRCGDAPDAVVANRAALVDTLALPRWPLWLRQVHGIGVFDADKDTVCAREPESDAAITHAAGRVLAVLTADCLPILFCADDGSAVGVAHAGWRGLAGGVIEATIAGLNVPVARVLAWLGPAIAAASYEVGDEVRAVFVAVDPRAADAFASTRPGHWLCDLYALARQRLVAAGVTRIYGGHFDTFQDARFYSYRRECETGRFATLIWIEPAAKIAPVAESTSFVSLEPQPMVLFPRLLGNTFACLPPRVRALHLQTETRRYRGEVEVERGHGLLAVLCIRAAHLPPAGQGPIEVEISADAHGERWSRHVAGHTMRSRMWSQGDLVYERLGLVTFGFRLHVQAGNIVWRVVRVSVLGVPCLHAGSRRLRRASTKNVGATASTSALRCRWPGCSCAIGVGSMSAEKRDDASAIIVVDGVCVLCNGWVRFLLRHDRARRYCPDRSRPRCFRVRRSARHVLPPPPR
ncbi:MAG: peptidoglycan editing factor PgeF [Dokdonella sp.]